MSFVNYTNVIFIMGIKNIGGGEINETCISIFTKWSIE